MCDEQLVHGWLRHLEALNYASTTLDTYGVAMERFMGRFCLRRGVRLTEITPEHLDEYIASMGAQGPHRTQASHVLRLFFKWAARRGHVPEDPSLDMLPRPVPQAPRRAFTEDEIVRLLVAAAFRDERRAWAILACYSMGLRRSELCAVTPEDVDGPDVLIRGKGLRYRRIPLEYLQRSAIDGLRPWWNGTILGSIKPPTFTKWVNDAARDAGIPWDRRRAHMLRGAMVKSLLKRGAPIHDVRDIAGHANLKTTDQYAESEESDRRADMARMGRV